MRKLTFAIATLAVATALTPAASAADKKKTTVTLDQISMTWPAPGEDPMNLYEGIVKSNKLDCKNKREVTVFFVQDGKDEKIGTAKAKKDSMSGKYAYTVKQSGWMAVGEYYAKAPQTGSCEGDKSERLQGGVW